MFVKNLLVLAVNHLLAMMRDMQAQQKEASSSKPAIKFKTVPDMFYYRAEKSAGRVAFRYPDNGRWTSMTWSKALERVQNIAGGLLELGLEIENRCGVLSQTRVDWVLADLGVACAGGATTTIYPSNTADECAYILNDSETKVCFIENALQLDKLRSEKPNLTSMTHAVLFEGESDEEWVFSLAELEKMGAEYNRNHPDALKDIAGKLTAEHLSTLIYTSGTTGRPKGVKLVNECWCYTGEAIDNTGILNEKDLQFLWLPLAHSFGKCLLSSHLATGYEMAIDGEIPKLIDNLAIVRPTFMAAAPRIFEKVYNKVIAGAKAGGGLKLKIFTWSLAVGREVSRLRQNGKEPSGLLAAKYKVADKLVFSKLKEKFGGRVRFFISGSAPLSRDIAEFFHAADILILEGYGLTESSAATVVNRPKNFKFGSVGMPVPGTEMKIAESDGEIMLRGPGIMRGYHNLPEQTAAMLNDEGWLLTGDIGEIDAQGFLRITDRKKDLIKTSGGKYVAPQALEGKFKAICPYVSQIIVHGDKRNYCTALIALDPETMEAWAQENGHAQLSYAEITQRDDVRALVQNSIDKLNAGLARYETIKKFRIFEKDLTVEDGELTPSLKVKRKHVEKQNMHLLDEMYSGALESV